MVIRRVEGGVGTLKLECVNKIRDKWRVRWDYVPSEENLVSYMEAEFDHKPTSEEIKTLISGYYNELTDQKILSGFVWNNIPVWLSSENQFNFKAAHDLAAQTDGATLPVTFKLGTDEEPVYHEFKTLEELQDFYMKAIQFIQECLKEGWEKKNEIGIY